MPRPELTHPYVESKQAASVIMLRQAGNRLEVYVQHRATTIDFAAGAVVSSGRRTDAGDALYKFGEPTRPVLLDHVKGWQKTSLGDTNQDKALNISSMMLRTGLREVAEETGVGLQPG